MAYHAHSTSAPINSPSDFGDALTDYQIKCAAFDANEDESDEVEGALYGFQIDAWGRLLATPAPDVEALAIKLHTLLRHAHASDQGADVNNPAWWRSELASSNIVDGAGTIIRLWQDALRLAGIEHPVLDLQGVSAGDSLICSRNPALRTPAALPEMQCAWELARAARNVFATEDDDREMALGQIEDHLERRMLSAPAETVTDVSVKLWLLSEAFDAQWRRADVALLLSQVDTACRHLARVRRNTVAGGGQ